MNSKNIYEIINEFSQLKKGDIIYNVSFDRFIELVVGEDIDVKEVEGVDGKTYKFLHIITEDKRNIFLSSRYKTTYGYYIYKKDAIDELKRLIDYHNNYIEKHKEYLEKLTIALGKL